MSVELKPGREKDFLLDEFSRLQRFSGPPSEFWPLFMAATGNLLAASRVILLRQDGEGGRWKKLADWNGPTVNESAFQLFLKQLETLATRCIQEGSLCQPLSETEFARSVGSAIGMVLQISETTSPCVLLACLPEKDLALAGSALRQLSLAAILPGILQNQETIRRARVDVEKFAGVLDLLVLVQVEKRFLAGCLAFCNGVATHLGCERVSLGWLENGYVRLKAISRMERFDQKMAIVNHLEKVMEESLDQNDEVVWPPLENGVITRDHESFSTEQKCNHICSLPLRLDQKPAGVLTCERQSRGFTGQELHQLRLACDVVISPLAVIKKNDRWFGKRWMGGFREKAANLVGPQHTLFKVTLVTAMILLGVAIFGKTQYRVEGDFELHSEAVSYLTVPFDGFIHQVLVRPGDSVKAGDPLLKLSTEDLKLEESAALADVNRYQREMEKARAAQLVKSANAVAELRIAQTLVDQAQTRLDLVRHRLAQAVLKAPFEGVVVEGDLRERLGAPVREGEVLLKIAEVKALYVEVEMPEEDIHEVRIGGRGAVALLTQPRLKFPITVVQIEPAAFAVENKNVFRVRCALSEPAPPWWRPGMTGICKIDAGNRTWLWVGTHRSIDFLRMKLWW